jgi:hypothetical protein
MKYITCVLIAVAIGAAPAASLAQSIAAYDPPAGAAPFFPGNPFSARLPNPPTVNPNSAAWVVGLGAFSLNTLTAYTAAGVLHDHHEPVYFNHSGSNTPVTIHCTANFGHIPCSTEGMPVYVDSREIPQNGGAPGEDDHLALIDTAEGYEYDFWGVTWPPSDGVLITKWAGRCALSGNGFTNPSYTGKRWNGGCASQAAGAPITLGLIRAKDLLAAVQTGGTLPQAIAVAVTCPGPGPLPAPFLGSGDGKCPGNAPEGSRMYLAMHDSDVNALGVAPIVAAILRTLDEDNYGAFIVERGGKQSGIQMFAEADSTYTVWGQPGPFLTQYAPEAAREGLPGASALQKGYKYDIQLPIPPSVGASLRFL